MGEPRHLGIGIRLQVTPGNLRQVPAASRREAACRAASVALRRWRCERGLGQADAAAALDCSVRQFRVWESGRTCPPGWVVVLVAEWEGRKAA